MRQVCWAMVATVLAGCSEAELLRRPDPVPGVELSNRQARAECRPVEAVEVRAGHHDPTSHELLKALAAERGANYVVLDAFAVVSTSDDIYAITQARLFQCPPTLVCWPRPATQ
jgi:hypothetical protein